MKFSNIFIGIISMSLAACGNSDRSAGEYFKIINLAELQIIENDFHSASDYYKKAFRVIEKPFGKDVYNAVIVNSEIGEKEKVLEYIQALVNNSEDLSMIKSTLVGNYISHEKLNKALKQQNISYNESLRKEMERIKERDQEFRPLYDTHMDTIENIRKDNLEQMFQFSTNNELPGHQENRLLKQFTKPTSPHSFTPYRTKEEPG